MLWEEIISTSKKMDTAVKHVFREYMQKTVLTVLSRNGYFNKLVFQGGTALRLFYGNPQFSEDIDLVVKQGENEIDVTGLSSKVETFAKDWFSFLNQVSVTQQKDTSEMQRFIVKTKGEQESQITRIHIEIAYVPSYLNQPKILDFPPLNPAVRIEEPAEILADKLTALGCRSYVKGRDLWDIYFLTEEKNVDTSRDLISRKIADYGYKFSSYQERLEKAKNKITSDGTVILSDELKRFLPYSLFQQYEDMFDQIVKRVLEIIKDVQKKDKGC